MGPITRKPRDVDCETSADDPYSLPMQYPGQPHHSLPSISSNDDEFDAILQAIDKAKPIVSQVTFGSIVGYCSGAAAKQIGKALAVVVGLGFMILQGAVHTGYISVDWKKVQDDAVKVIDTTGDGKITLEDFKAYWLKVKKLLTKEIPSASGFSLGFLYGLSS